VRFHRRQLLCFSVLLAFGCSSSKPPAKSARPNVDQPWAQTVSSNGYPNTFAMQPIPRRAEYHYVSADGGEAIVSQDAHRIHILFRSHDEGAFHPVPYSPIEAPVVLPLPTGQLVIASRDQILLHSPCPDNSGCGFTESISSPTRDAPQDLSYTSGLGPDHSLQMLMVNGTGSVYVYSLLQRAWRTLPPLPANVHAVAVRNSGGYVLVLDQRGESLWMTSEDATHWKKIDISANSEEPKQMLESVGDYVIVGSPQILEAASVRALQDSSNGSSSNGDKLSTTWRQLALPAKEPLAHLSANPANVYATMQSGDIYQIDEGNLVSGPARSWRPFFPPADAPTQSEQLLRVRAIGSELLAFTASGIEHSNDYGNTWSREPIDQNVHRIDEIENSGRLYSLTEDQLLVSAKGATTWQRAGNLKDECAAKSGPAPSALLADHLVEVDTGRFATILTSSGAHQSAVCLFDTATNKFDMLGSGSTLFEDSALYTVINHQIVAATERGIVVWLPREHRWATPQESGSPSRLPEWGKIMVIAPYGASGAIIATATGNIEHAALEGSAFREWAGVRDAGGQLARMVGFANARIVDILVNPRRLDEIYILAYQLFTNCIYSRDINDSLWFETIVSNDVPLSFVVNNARQVWVAGSSRVYSVQFTRAPPGSVEDIEQRLSNRLQELAKSPPAWITGILGSYGLAVLCVLVLRYLPVPAILGRNWLASLVVKPFTISPWSGRWILFLGYRSRLRKLLKIPVPYFGLPALLPNGAELLADGSGTRLHDALLSQARKSKVLLLVGRPGAGKTMLLNRLAYAAINGENPEAHGVLPILVTADDYDGDLIECVSKILRERHAVPLDKEDMFVGQMQAGKIMILFDGLSEVSTSRSAAVADFLRLSRMPEFRNCSLVVTSRAFDGLPDFSVCQILPVRGDQAITEYLPLFAFDAEKRAEVERNILAFHNQPIDVQLLAMTIEASGTRLDAQRHEIFTSFFRKRLDAEGDDVSERWTGLCLALELMAKWFCLDTGVKSVGLSPRAIIDAVESITSENHLSSANKDLLSELRDLYNVEFPTASALLQYLKANGILVRIDRWRFAHDTFEEYFCASYLARSVREGRGLPTLPLWRSQAGEFVEVFAFFYGLLGDAREEFDDQELPEAWRRASGGVELP
jgi:hypothetical protein